MVCPSQRSAVSVRGSANNWSLLQPRSFGPWDSKNIFVPGITEDEKDDAHNAVLRLMDHGVGEEARRPFAERRSGSWTRTIKRGFHTACGPSGVPPAAIE
jgi:hypothetical protein